MQQVEKEYFENFPIVISSWGRLKLKISQPIEIKLSPKYILYIHGSYDHILYHININSIHIDVEILFAEILCGLILI